MNGCNQFYTFCRISNHVLSCIHNSNYRVEAIKDSSIFQIPEYPVIGYGDADTESLAQTVSRLNLHCVGEEAAGVYECVADNLHGLTDKVGTRVQVASEWNKNVFCLVGTVKLKCLFFLRLQLDQLHPRRRDRAVPGRARDRGVDGHLPQPAGHRGPPGLQGQQGRHHQVDRQQRARDRRGVGQVHGEIYFLAM